MEKNKESDSRRLKEYLSNFAEVSECLDKLDLKIGEMEVIVKVEEKIHNEIQEEISFISHLKVDKTETFSVNISHTKFTFIK